MDIATRIAKRRKDARNPWRAYIGESASPSEAELRKIFARLRSVAHLFTSAASGGLARSSSAMFSFPLTTAGQAQKPAPGSNGLTHSRSDSSLNAALAANSVSRALANSLHPSAEDPSGKLGSSQMVRTSSASNLSKLFLPSPYSIGSSSKLNGGMANSNKKQAETIKKIAAMYAGDVMPKPSKWKPALSTIFEEGIFT